MNDHMVPRKVKPKTAPNRVVVAGEDLTPEQARQLAAELETAADRAEAEQ